MQFWKFYLFPKSVLFRTICRKTEKIVLRSPLTGELRWKQVKVLSGPATVIGKFLFWQIPATGNGKVNKNGNPSARKHA